MKKILTFAFLITAVSHLFGQMNFQDSSVQVITYWDMGEKYTYAVEDKTLKFSETDTTENETITYEIDVSVVDSTEKSYTVRWIYRDFHTTNTDPIVQKITSLTDSIVVDIVIDEMGAIEGVKNWEEVAVFMEDAIKEVKKELGDVPQLNSIFDQMGAMYSTKLGVENTAIKDAHQMHNFHGGMFALNDTVTGNIKTPNLYYPEQPFDTEVSVIVEKMDAENNEYVIRSFQEVDAAQLTETTYKYVSGMMEKMGQKVMPREEFMDISNIVETVSRIHNTGWVLESIEWKEVVAEGVTQLKTRSIYMK